MSKSSCLPAWSRRLRRQPPDIVAIRCLTFVVHGIGQYHRAQQGVNSQFFKERSRDAFLPPVLRKCPR